MFTFLERYLSRMSGKSMPVDLDAVKPFMGFCTAINMYIIINTQCHILVHNRKLNSVGSTDKVEFLSSTKHKNNPILDSRPLSSYDKPPTV